MTDEPRKLPPVEIRPPSMVRQRSNDIRVNVEKAGRIIARSLREAKVLPQEAGRLANEICESLIASAATPGMTGLRNARVIQDYPPHSAFSQLAAAAKRSVGMDEMSAAREIWDAVYSCGLPIPDDLTV